MLRTSHTSTIEELAPSAITTDPQVNTRPVDKTWVVRKLREGFDVKRLGVPTVSARIDGTYIWVDGQNRGALCKAADRADIKIGMKVFHGLTISEEAELFLGLNDNRRVQPIYKFLAEVTAGREEAMAIVKIAGDAGWKIADGTGAKTIHAVAAMTAIYRAVPGNPGDLLRRCLSIVTRAWGHIPDAVNAHILQGLESVLRTCPDLDEAVLVKKLAGHAGGPVSLLGKGRGFREATSCTVVQGVDQVIRLTYNTGRRSGKLPTWGPPGPRSGEVQENIGG
ncbi:MULTISPECIES: DUF6551 family protein [Kitasatospora]|uniref:DUF6551 family protein n=1 Tax=Kitasatospora TaxID=2063 RepID=UPI0011D2B8C4|nr:MULTISPECIES: DUF6551 family protein [Kitasatospora]